MRIHRSWLWMFSSCSPVGGDTDKCCPLVEQLLLKQSHIVSFPTLIHTFYSPVDRQLTCPVFFRCAPKKYIISVCQLSTNFVSSFFPPLSDLPASPVDLVINCLDCHENRLLREQSWHKSAADWANQNRAPVLSIDPSVSEQHQPVQAKWTLSLGLPLLLTEAESRVYLCDIGIPKQVFQEVGIRYHSPFGCKFVIPLHSA